MKIILPLIIFFFYSNSLLGKKSYLPLEMVIGSADLIVVGKIDEIQNETYHFKVDETIRGKQQSKILVQKFREWTCDIRMRKIKKGQKLVLFLQEKLGKYEIIDGSSGELIIETDKTLKQFNGSHRSLNELVHTIRDFVQCYELIGGISYGPPSKIRFKQLVSGEEHKTIERHSELSTWLFARISNYSVIRLSKKVSIKKG